MVITMKVSELRHVDIKVGLRIRGLETGKIGTVVSISNDGDDYAWILWDGESKVTSGFYGNACECEVIYVPGGGDEH